MVNPEDSRLKEENTVELGKFYFLNNRYERAVEEFKKALLLNPHNAEACYNLGLVYQAKNVKEQALKMYEKALAINPGYQLARNHLNKIKGIEQNGRR